MPRLCIFCLSSKREELERQISTGQITQTEAGRIIGVGRGGIRRHMSNHFTPAVRDLMKQDNEKALALSAVDALIEQYKIVTDFLKQAIESGNIKDVALMLHEGRKHIELNARLTGQLDGPTTQINLLNDPTFIWLKDVIINTLEPDARLKLSAKLQEMAVTIDEE